jgi:hypothetical protein
MTLEEAKAILAALVREHVEFVVIGSKDRADAARIREAFGLGDE